MVAERIQSILLDPGNQLQELSEIMQLPTKRMLFTYLSLLRIDIDPSRLEDRLAPIMGLVTSIDLQSYNHYHKVYQVLLA